MKKILQINNISLNLSKVLMRLPLPVALKKSFNLSRHRKIIYNLRPIFDKALLSIESVSVNDKVNSNEGPIWVFWWQGMNGMPLIIKKCYESVISHSSKRKVILITKNNYKNYTDISMNILQKLKENKITLTHFSDILRFNLLKNHGGLWLDATVFVTKEIDLKYFSNFYTCSGFPDVEYFFIAKGRWTGFLIGGRKNNPLFQYMNNFFELYWKNNNELIDYFLIDYALWFAWKNNISDFKQYTQKYKGKNNPNLFELQKLLNVPFDVHKFNSINFNTGMYKLSYKKEISNNSNTFFNTLINN